MKCGTRVIPRGRYINRVIFPVPRQRYGGFGMKALIIGASGQIGHCLYEILKGGHQVTGTFFSYPQAGLIKLDMTEREKVHKLVGALVPEVVLIPAAMPNVEACEEKPEFCYQVNVDGVGHVLDAAAQVGAKIVYFSTDYVFDGAAGPYSETDRPNPISVYGRAKYAVEQRIQRSCSPWLIIRTTVVYGPEQQGKNFVMGLIRRLKQGAVVKVPRDQVGTPTYAPNLCRVVKELVELGKEGIYNVAGPDLMNRYQFALAVAETFELDKSLIVPVSTAELGQKAPRPLNGGLKINKVQAQIKTPLAGVYEGLREMKRIM